MISGVRGTSFVPRTFLPDSLGMGAGVGGEKKKEKRKEKFLSGEAVK